jgi:cell wall-associated NlpC family hydrolase
MWVSRLPKGQEVAIVSQWQGWYAIIMADGSQAYVPGTTVEVLPFQVRSVSPAKAPAPNPAPAPAARPMGMTTSRFAPQVKAAVQEAMRYVGTPYVYGGNSETGIDCSGLVRNCFLAQGINLPRRASEQAQIGDNVPLDRLELGDRLYFSVKKEYDHTGLYLGNGYFVHASMSRGQVAVDHLSTPLYGTHLAAARRF